MKFESKKTYSPSDHPNNFWDVKKFLLQSMVHQMHIEIFRICINEKNHHTTWGLRSTPCFRKQFNARLKEMFEVVTTNKLCDDSFSCSFLSIWAKLVVDGSRNLGWAFTFARC